MPLVKDEAIVLRRLDYSESSQVLVFFTREHGPQRLIAKGIKRGTKQRFATGIDLLERGHVVFLGKANTDASLGTMTEWRQANAYLGLRDRLDRWYAAQYAAEITASMTEEADADSELFDALAALLETLAAGGPGGTAVSSVIPNADPETPPCDAAIPAVESLLAEQRHTSSSAAAPVERAPLPIQLLAGYQAALLVSAGLWPDLTRCVVCDRPAPPGRAGYYSAHQGGLICRNCAVNQPETRRASGPVLDALRAGEIAPELAAEAFDLLDYTIGQAIGRPTALGSLVLQQARRA